MFLALALAAAVVAPTAAPLDSTKITGFGKVKWGATQSAVERAHGKLPSRSITPKDWGVELYYIEPRFGVTGITRFNVHRTRGLISGSYLYPFGSEQQCEDLFTAFRDMMTALYGTPTEANVGAGSLRYCTGAGRGDNGVRLVWTDDSGARVTIRIKGAGVSTEVEIGQ